MARLQLSGLTKTYGDFHAVAGIDLDIAQGELVLLLGPSGCGKTTTLRMVAGFVQPTAGDIRLGGQDITKRPSWRRNTGLVFQSYALFPHLTAAENIGFGLRMRKLPPATIASKITEALRLVRLEGLADRLPRELSGGQQQRVALARALVIAPDVLLLDEPLSNLDAKLRVEMRGEIRRLQKTLGITVVYVTHDQDEALSMSDRIAVMRAGRVEQIGEPAAIYGAPASPFVAKFVGATNLFEGVVARRTGDAIEVTIEGGSLRVTDARAQAGERVEISIRPEAIRVLSAGDSAPAGWCTLTGSLGGVEYLGAVTRLYVRVSANGPALQVAVAAAPAGGGEIRLAYDPARAVVWTKSQ